MISSYACLGEIPDLNIDFDNSVNPVDEGTQTWFF